MLGVMRGAQPQPSIRDPLHHSAVRLDLVGLALDVLRGLPPEHVWRCDGIVDMVRDHALLAAAVWRLNVGPALDLRAQGPQHTLQDAPQRLAGVAVLGHLCPTLEDKRVAVCLQGDPRVHVRQRGVDVVIDAYGLVVLRPHIPDYVQADLAPVGRGQRHDDELAAVQTLRALVRDAWRPSHIVSLQCLVKEGPKLRWHHVVDGARNDALGAITTR
mmetsp:Transcript_18037/g.49782  ORF Transcript_18037/g.49782 Transcript_18037/m.49782 type:complete len:215 (+) Transcript_18037:488-1132(+)